MNMNWKKWMVLILVAAFVAMVSLNQRLAIDEKYLTYEDIFGTPVAENVTPELTESAQVTETVQATAAPTKGPTAAPTVAVVAKPKATPTAVPVLTPAIPVGKEPTAVPTRVPQATPGATAKENVAGVQAGWGKAVHPSAASMTLKQLPKSGVGSVKTNGTTGRAVTVTADTYLKLYGLYEDEKGDVYRHVGVTYLGEEYYGYILEERITYSAAPPTATPRPTATPIPVVTWIPVPPVPTSAPVVIVPTQPIYRPTVAPVATATSVPTATKAPTNVPVATATPVPTATKAPTSAPVATATPKPTATKAPTIAPVATATPVPTPTIAPTTPKYELVSSGYYDYNVIPDKYNTGCSGGLTKINSACTVDGVEYNMGDNGGTVVIDLYYRNKDMASEVVIRNKDFSDCKFAVRHSEKSAVKRTIRFVNCKFAVAATGIDQSSVVCYFTNCTFQNFYGSDATFTRCYFGDRAGDGMNPFRNIAVQNCYFAGFPQNMKGDHGDAIQVFGKAGIDAENIIFRNSRIEIPIIASRKGGINACFMVQLEYSTGRNFLFEDCIINGGGYSIYARGTKGQEVYNVTFRNISIGRGRLYREVYPDKSPNVMFDNLKETTKLYVSTVWKDEAGRTRISVTNDTASDRTLLIVTENGKQEFLIPCQKTAEAAGAQEYYDLPIDIDIVADTAGTDWIVCYDGTERAENQIRFVNWGTEPVYRTVQ